MTFDSIHNYYEPLVIDYVMNHGDMAEGFDDNALEDVVCLALNQLPPRYVRRDADIALFLTTREREKMQRHIAEAVLNALHTLSQQDRGSHTT